MLTKVVPFHSRRNPLQGILVGPLRLAAGPLNTRFFCVNDAFTIKSPCIQGPCGEAQGPYQNPLQGISTRMEGDNFCEHFVVFKKG